MSYPTLALRIIKPKVGSAPLRPKTLQKRGRELILHTSAAHGWHLCHFSGVPPLLVPNPTKTWTGAHMGHLCGSQRTPLPLLRGGPKRYKNVGGSSFSTPLRVMEDTSAITGPPRGPWGLPGGLPCIINGITIINRRRMQCISLSPVPSPLRLKSLYPHLSVPCPRPCVALAISKKYWRPTWDGKTTNVFDVCSS